MKKLWPLFIICFSSLLIPMAFCYDYSYNVMPGKGDYDDPILIWVRVDPMIDDKQMWLYVFIDDVPILTRVSCQSVGKTGYNHMWDKTITIPRKLATEGKHMIEIWVETEAGDIKQLHYQYTVTDGLPPIDVWEEYVSKHPEIINDLMGPDGQKGDKGNTGDRGPRGKVGETGPVGETGKTGAKGVRGERGPMGLPGSVSFTQLFFTAIVSAILSMVGVVGMKWFGVFSAIDEAKLRISEEKC